MQRSKPFFLHIKANLHMIVNKLIIRVRMNHRDLQHDWFSRKKNQSWTKNRWRQGIMSCHCHGNNLATLTNQRDHDNNKT